MGRSIELTIHVSENTNLKKEIRDITPDGSRVRITTSDERWYLRAVRNAETDLPEYKTYPSVTWIVSLYPKQGLQRYRDQVGAEEAELAKKLGGERGSKVHEAISAIIAGEEVKIDSKFTNPNTGQPEELSADELRYLSAFVEWKKKTQPIFLTWDLTVYSDTYGYAGTIDAVAIVDGEVWLLDFKTSKVLDTGYDMQVSAYGHALTHEDKATAVENALTQLNHNEIKLALLHLGTTQTKTNPEEYRWKPVENKMELFIAQKKIWEDVYETQIKDRKGFSQKDFPVIISAGKTEGGMADVAKGTESPATGQINANNGELKAKTRKSK